MRPAYTVAQIRALEDDAMTRLGDDALMQRAAHGLFVHAVRLLTRRRGSVYGARIVIMTGPGNNGGDALYAGARLARRGCLVVTVRALGTPHAAGLSALLEAGGRAVELDEAGTPTPALDLVLDGVLGIGGRPGLPSDVAIFFAGAQGAGVPVLAVDLPSGVDTDTGTVGSDAVRADVTVTFGALKPVHLIEPGRERCGEVSVVDIGLDLSRADAAYAQWEPEDVIACWPVPGPTSDKYRRGVVGVDTGSEEYPGAAIMSTTGAVCSGAGMVRFQGPDSALAPLTQLLPNVVHGSGRVQSFLLGSGWGQPRDGRDRVEGAIATGLPVVVDADGLRFLPSRLRPSVLLTPHAGELARLLGVERSAVEADPGASVRTAVRRTGATVLLKGATQFVGSPERDRIEIAVPGPAWTGQAGSGDTLAGICATLLAAGLPAREAAVCAASMQAMTAARNPGPLPPQELAHRMADEIGRLTSGQDRP